MKEVINFLNLHKSVGLDNISLMFCAASTNIALAICLFIENAYRIGIFPHSCKMA